MSRRRRRHRRYGFGLLGYVALMIVVGGMLFLAVAVASIASALGFGS